MNKKTDLINSKSLKINNELFIPSLKFKRKFHIKNNSNEGIMKINLVEIIYQDKN